MPADPRGVGVSKSVGQGDAAEGWTVLESRWPLSSAGVSAEVSRGERKSDSRRGLRQQGCERLSLPIPALVFSGNSEKQFAGRGVGMCLVGEARVCF